MNRTDNPFLGVVPLGRRRLRNHAAHERTRQEPVLRTEPHMCIFTTPAVHSSGLSQTHRINERELATYYKTSLWTVKGSLPVELAGLTYPVPFWTSGLVEGQEWVLFVGSVSEFPCQPGKKRKGVPGYPKLAAAP